MNQVQHDRLRSWQNDREIWTRDVNDFYTISSMINLRRWFDDLKIDNEWFSNLTEFSNIWNSYRRSQWRVFDSSAKRKTIDFSGQRWIERNIFLFIIVEIYLLSIKSFNFNKYFDQFCDKEIFYYWRSKFYTWPVNEEIAELGLEMRYKI